MQYAVVSFINEYIEEENVVSEVPLTWLHTKNTMCKWPPKHESFHILKYSVPKLDWTDHPIKCERICGSREEARRKCIRNPEDGSSTATEIDMGRKFRKKRPNKLLTNYYTTCPSPPHFDDDTDNEGSEVPEAIQHVQLPQIEAALVYQELQPSTQPEAIQDLPLPQIEGPLELQFPAQPQAIQDLPLPQVEALVYQECSWKGFRKNYKMEDLAVTKCIYDAVNGTFPTTFKEFEILTRDYLRHAKQRKEREQKK